MNPVIRRILVPVDFSAHSDRAVAYAIQLASEVGAALELLHVVEDPILSGAWSPECCAPAIAALLGTIASDARTRLETVRASLAGRNVAVSSTVVTGQPAPSIVDYAVVGEFDLIVMGTHGRTGLSHALVGSVAERVSRRAPCPVLTIRDALPARPSVADVPLRVRG
jgi:nucleotide-binding universal stress UspA family protein